jgi:hypothetical protein
VVGLVRSTFGACHEKSGREAAGVTLVGIARADGFEGFTHPLPNCDRGRRQCFCHCPCPAILMLLPESGQSIEQAAAAVPNEIQFNGIGGFQTYIVVRRIAGRIAREITRMSTKR